MIVVKDKRTYLFLLSIVIGLLKIFFLDINSAGVQYGDVFVSIMIMLVGIYMFVRVNTYSHFYNPDHPKKKDE